MSSRQTKQQEAVSANAVKEEPLPRSRSIADFRDELTVEYVKAADLAGAPVLLLSATAREAQGKFKASWDFEVQYTTGESRGCTATVSLGRNMVRDRLANVVNQNGPIGPVVLTKVGEAKGGNDAPWGFIDATLKDPAQKDAFVDDEEIPF